MSCARKFFKRPCYMPHRTVQRTSGQAIIRQFFLQLRVTRKPTTINLIQDFVASAARKDSHRVLTADDTYNFIFNN